MRKNVGWLTLKDDRIIGWLKKGVLTEKEARFCEGVYGKERMMIIEWLELERINEKVGKL